MAVMFEWWLMILEFKVFFTMCWHRSNGLNEFPSALQITHCHLSLDRAILLMETIFIGYITYHHFLNLLRKKDGWTRYFGEEILILYCLLKKAINFEFFRQFWEDRTSCREDVVWVKKIFIEIWWNLCSTYFYSKRKINDPSNLSLNRPENSK